MKAPAILCNIGLGIALDLLIVCLEKFWPRAWYGLHNSPGPPSYFGWVVVPLYILAGLSVWKFACRRTTEQSRLKAGLWALLLFVLGVLMGGDIFFPAIG
jgi:hypothetical protein